MGYPKGGSSGVLKNPLVPDVEYPVPDHRRAGRFTGHTRFRAAAAGGRAFPGGPPPTGGLPHCGHLLRAIDIEVGEESSRQALRQVVLPLWRAWSSLVRCTGCGTGHVRVDPRHPLDRYLLARTKSVVADTGAAMDDYDLPRAYSVLRDHVDVVTDFYLRSSRPRFADGDQEAFSTLRTALEVLCGVLTPLLPMTTQRIWRGLTGDRSAHPLDWPPIGELPADPDLVRVLDRVRQVLSVALARRDGNGPPPAELVVAAADVEELVPHADLLCQWLDVERVRFTADTTARDRWQLVVNARRSGPPPRSGVQEITWAACAGRWAQDAAVAVLPGGWGLLVLAGSSVEEDTEAGSAAGGFAAGGFAAGAREGPAVRVEVSEVLQGSAVSTGAV